MDASTNGLSYLAEHFKHLDISGHVTLSKGERSTMAELASNLLELEAVMVDSSWDNSGMPAAKRGMSLWAKIGLGCGVGAAAGPYLWGMRLVWPAQGVRGAGRPVDHRAFNRRKPGFGDGRPRAYASNPGLKDSYPTEGEFLAAASTASQPGHRSRPASGFPDPVQGSQARSPRRNQCRDIAYGISATRWIAANALCWKPRTASWWNPRGMKLDRCLFPPIMAA